MKSCFNVQTRARKYLDVSRKGSENIVNLVLETSGKHLIGLIENEDLDVSGVDDLRKLEAVFGRALTFLVIISNTRPGVPTMIC